ncbi:cytochrome c [Yoonia sp. R2331]|uniref:c-type cytochrome n=1 Tax=Yoonia sp. R2331 TaxID=3237238 RepID=UPI0034E4E32C
MNKILSTAMAVALFASATWAEDVAPPNIETGRALYFEVCAACHGSTGAGGSAPDLRPAAEAFDVDGFVFFIQNPPDSMPGFASALSEMEMRDIAAFVASLAPT